MRWLLIMLVLTWFRFGTGPAPLQAPQAVQKAPVAEVQVDKPIKAVAAAKADDLAAPVALKADGKLIDVEIGHAAPFVADIGDGKQSLLVGQFGGGKLRVYQLDKNGDGFKPGKFEWLKAGTGDCSVPSG